MTKEVKDQKTPAQPTTAGAFASVTPKKISNPYMCFLKQQHAKLKEENPDLKPTEVFALVGQTWREMSEKDRYPFILQSEKDKLRYTQ